jgi:hypothetical protein
MSRSLGLVSIISAGCFLVLGCSSNTHSQPHAKLCRSEPMYPTWPTRLRDSFMREASSRCLIPTQALAVHPMWSRI